MGRPQEGEARILWGTKSRLGTRWDCWPGKSCLPGVDENPESFGLGGVGWGGLAAGDSPKTSIHLLFRLTQVCWSLAYLLMRVSRSLESLVYSYEYFYPSCTVSTHKLPLSSGRLAMAGGRNYRVKPDLRRSEALSHRPPRKSQKSFQVSNPQRRHAPEMEGKPSTEANKISNSHTPSCRNLDL